MQTARNSIDLTAQGFSTKNILFVDPKDSNSEGYWMLLLSNGISINLYPNGTRSIK